MMSAAKRSEEIPMNSLSTPPDKTKDQFPQSQQFRSHTMNMIVGNQHPSRMRIQDLPIDQIEILPGQQKFGNPTARVASIQRLGLVQPIVVTPRDSRYWVLVDPELYHACYLLGWTTIPAIVLSVDDQHAELIAIDAKLIREELSPSERDELRQRRR